MTTEAPKVESAPDSQLSKPVPPPPSTSSAPVLEFEPTTSPMSLPTSAGSTPEPSGLALLVNRVRTSAASVFKDRKPWSDFTDRTAYSRPANFGEVSTRIQKNLAYYRTNYLIFFLAVMAITFLTNPGTLIWTGLLLSAWIYLFLVRTTPIVINGREYSEREKLIGMSAISFIVVFFLTSVGAIVLYGTSLSLAMVALHGALREPDDLFLDDPNASANLFSNTNIFSGVQTLQTASKV